MTARHYIKYLQLLPHPEGGYYKESYRSSGILPSSCLPGFGGNRSFSTAIYFLLEQGDFSAFHRIKSDECWHFYEGETLLIHVLQQNGEYICKRLGKNLEDGEVLQFVVSAGAWFASEPAAGTSFALVGCTVAPGFDFEDFEMAKKENLVQEFPEHTSLIKRLCR
jgi:predicted cupin superfamily sugar epimerase